MTLMVVSLIIGVVIGVIAGMFIFRNNTAKAEKFLDKVEDKYNEVKEKI